LINTRHFFPEPARRLPFCYVAAPLATEEITREKTRTLKKKKRREEFDFSYALLPLLPPARLVVSCGIGVTSSILPTLKPLRAIALIAA
jgi:hypothetical protein